MYARFGLLSTRHVGRTVPQLTSTPWQPPTHASSEVWERGIYKAAAAGSQARCGKCLFGYAKDGSLERITGLHTAGLHLWDSFSFARICLSLFVIPWMYNCFQILHHKQTGGAEEENNSHKAAKCFCGVTGYVTTPGQGQGGQPTYRRVPRKHLGHEDCRPSLHVAGAAVRLEVSFWYRNGQVSVCVERQVEDRERKTCAWHGMAYVGGDMGLRHGRP